MTLHWWGLPFASKLTNVNKKDVQSLLSLIQTYLESLTYLNVERSVCLLVQYLIVMSRNSLACYINRFATGHIYTVKHFEYLVRYHRSPTILLIHNTHFSIDGDPFLVYSSKCLRSGMSQGGVTHLLIP